MHAQIQKLTFTKNDGVRRTVIAEGQAELNPAIGGLGGGVVLTVKIPGTRSRIKVRLDKELVRAVAELA